MRPVTAQIRWKTTSPPVSLLGLPLLGRFLPKLQAARKGGFFYERYAHSHRPRRLNVLPSQQRGDFG
jgi:hypothetical protein